MTFRYERLRELVSIQEGINCFGKPINRERVCQIAKILDYSGEVRLGVIPDDVLKVIRPSNEDVLTRRVNNAINWAVQEGYLGVDVNDTEIILPCE